MLGLDKTLQTVTKHLRAFTPAAKLLIGACMVIMVLTLVIVAMLTSQPDMVPLGLGAHLSPDVRAKAISYLDQRQVRWTESGGDVFVPMDEKYTVLAQLHENDLITTDQIDFSSIVKDDSPFTDRSTKQTRYLVAKMNEVARMISALRGIEHADVVIDQPQRPGGFGITRIEPTASVTVLTRGGAALDRAQADAIARMVAGAHAELKVSNVTVIDARSGHAVAVRSAEEQDAAEHLELTRARERHVRQKILDFLSFIPDVRVAVNAQVDASQVVTHRVGVDDPKLGVTEEKTRERNATNQRRAAEPGVRANAGDALALGSGRASTLSENESAVKSIPAFGTQDTSIRRDRGFALKINATIRVPRSWFVEMYRSQVDDPAAKPDPATLQSLVDAELAKIRADVEPLIDTGAREGGVPGTVVVSMFMDGAGPDGAEGGAGVAGASLASGTGLVGGLASEGVVRSVTLGVLAVVSLLLMFMMVRRASRTEDMPTAEELVGIPPALAEDEGELVGEADQTVAAMEGLEIDEGAVRRQQMLAQINDLALNSSDEAAALLRKWIKTDA